LVGISNSTGADQLAALLGPDTVAAGVNPRRADSRGIVQPAHHGRIAVAGQRDGPTLLGKPNRAGADQLTALLGPDAVAAGVDPRRPGGPGVPIPAHDGGVAVAGQRDGQALPALSDRARPDQLEALLGPDAVAAGVDPRRPGGPGVNGPAHDGGVAVAGERDGPALLGVSNRVAADQLRPLLRELRQR
jgi:hypothetical protein